MQKLFVKCAQKMSREGITSLNRNDRSLYGGTFIGCCFARVRIYFTCIIPVILLVCVGNKNTTKCHESGWQD